MFLTLKLKKLFFWFQIAVSFFFDLLTTGAILWFLNYASMLSSTSLTLNVISNHSAYVIKSACEN